MPSPQVESVGYTALIPRESGGGFFRFGYSESESKMLRFAAGRFGIKALENIHIVSAARLITGKVFVVDRSALKLMRGGK